MKLAVCHPGADTSTSDVYDGLIPALRRAGHEVIEYPLSTRILRAGSWLAFNYRKARRYAPDVPRPTFADTLYLAAERFLPICLRERVDWAIVLSGQYFHPDFFWMLRRAGVPAALLLTESPYDQDKEARVLPLVDVAWTNERSSVPFLRLANPRVHYLPHAYDPAKHTPDGTTVVLEDAGVGPDGRPVQRPAEVPAHDVVFVGTGFWERVEVLAGVDWSGIDLGLYGNWELPKRHPLQRFIRAGQVDNAYAAALYRRAKIGLNLYRKSISFGKDAPRIAHAESLNPRALELAACGTFSLSDFRQEVGEVFGELVPTFRTSAELEALIRGYLADEHGRQQMAARLPACVRERTFDAMAAHITGNLEHAMQPRIGGVA